MLKVGIDSLAIYTPRYVLDLATLAVARDLQADKFQAGLGQHCMSVTPPGEDVITMAANAGREVIADCDPKSIEMLLFATESGVDQSKAAGIYVHDLLKLNERCRVVELKQACYSATAAMQLALPYLRENPDKKVLLIASDIAKYGLHSVGESSQGAAAVAMLLSANPRLLAIDKEFGVAVENVMDFWRPNYSHEAFVDGKYSSKLYMTMLEKSWRQYQATSGRQLEDHAYFCYHVPVPKLVEKAHAYLLKVNGQRDTLSEIIAKQIQPALQYNRQIGNSYTAALYVSLTSLLENAENDLTNQRIALYSYGSGCVAEFFSGVVQENYHAHLKHRYHAELIQDRKILSYQEYADFYQFKYVEDGTPQSIPAHNTGRFKLSALKDHKRIYTHVEV